jgi:hypothetical protein
MGIRPHALYTELRADIHDQLPHVLKSYDKGYVDWPGITFRERAATSILASFMKKYEAKQGEEQQQRALDKFLQVNSACENWVSRLDERPYDDLLLGEFKDFIYKFWHRGLHPIVTHEFDVLKRGAFGPGAAIGSPGGDFYTKFFSSRLSCTSASLYFWYKRYIRHFPEWANSELTRVASHGEPEIVAGNRLSFVPKNDEISRTICTEPLLNMFYQLGLGNILSSRLKDLWGINLETQQFKNRELARKGSLFESFSTIDLSSASDSISIAMLRKYLPASFLGWLEKYRSTHSRLPDGTLVRLGMISTMGNGFTFPLQTILFTAIVLSAFKVSGMVPAYPRGNSEGNFGVNGDDIVVPTAISQKVLRLLHLLGFSPNPDKTFVEGPFRESCGGDYFKGRNLRGVYVKRLSAPQDLYSVINQLSLFSTRTGIRLSRCTQALLKNVAFLPVPLWENDDAGVKVPFSVLASLHRGRKDTNGSIIYQAWTPNPPPVMRIADRIYVPPGFKPRSFNPSGLLISILQGSVNSDGIPLLPKKVRYKRRRRIAANWDKCSLFMPALEPFDGNSETIRLFTSRLEGWRLETATYLNLFG